MSLIFEKISPLADKISSKIAAEGVVYKEAGLTDFDWYNKVYTSFSKFRRAHVEVLDRREKNNIWIMHTTIFPHIDDDAPIFGFDIVCTGNKVSGVFHDFSVTVNPNHKLIKMFAERVSNLKWKKERELPEWGKAIFSENMIAAGGSTNEEELQQIIDVCVSNLDLYLKHVGMSTLLTFEDSIKMQNRYCQYQKMNPYPVKMLTAYGYTKEQAENFVNNHLFPEMKFT